MLSAGYEWEQEENNKNLGEKQEVKAHNVNGESRKKQKREECDQISRT